MILPLLPCHVQDHVHVHVHDLGGDPGQQSWQWRDRQRQNPSLGLFHHPGLRSETPEQSRSSPGESPRSNEPHVFGVFQLLGRQFVVASRECGSMKNCSGMNFWSQIHAVSLMSWWQLLKHCFLSFCFKSYYEIRHVKWVRGGESRVCQLRVIIQALAKCKCHLWSGMNLSNSIAEKQIKAPMTELPPCQSSHVLMLQLSRGICSFAWMSFCFKLFEGDPLRVEKMLFSVYLKYSFSGSGLSEGWEGFLNIRGSNTTLKIQRSKLWGKAFKKWWYNYLWPGAGIWSDGVREITAKMFHCT